MGKSQMQHFIDNLVSERPFRVTSEDAGNALAVALTALHKLTREKQSSEEEVHATSGYCRW